MAIVGMHFEAMMGWLLSSVRGHDDMLFKKSASLQEQLKPTIEIRSPECPGNPAELQPKHSFLGQNSFPELRWNSPADSRIQEYAVVIEDPDAPLPSPVVHGIYFGIPPSKTTLRPEDFERVDKFSHTLKGQFQFGLNRRKNVWTGPRPVLEHGVHRYMFQVVGLDSHLELDGQQTGKIELEKAVQGHVVAWGVWQGNFERKYE